MWARFQTHTLEGVANTPEKEGRMGTAQLVETGIPRMAMLQYLVAEIQAYCAAHTEAQIVAKYAKYFKEGYDAYGVPEPELSTQRTAWLEAYRDEFGLEGFLDLGDLLWQTGKYELGFLLEWKDTAPRLIFQYATEKMTPENRARFRKAK